MPSLASTAFAAPFSVDEKCARRTVFVDRSRGQGEVGGGLVDVRDGEGEGLVECLASRVGGANGDAVLRLGLEVGDRLGAQCAADDLKQRPVSRDQGLGEGVSHIGIGGRDRANGGPDSCILGDRGFRESQVVGSLAPPLLDPVGCVPKSTLS